MLVLKPLKGCSTKIYDAYQKLSDAIGGGFALINNFVELKEFMELLATHATGTVKINYELEGSEKGDFLLFVNPNNFHRVLTNTQNISHMTNGEINETIVYHEHWPFLDDFLLNITTEKIPKRATNPTIIIGKETKVWNLPERFPYDPYLILNEKAITMFCKWSGVNPHKWNEYKNLTWPVRLKSKMHPYPFALIRIVPRQVPVNVHYFSTLLQAMTDMSFSMEKLGSITTPEIALEFDVLPYNYEELFNLCRKGKVFVGLTCLDTKIFRGAGRISKKLTILLLSLSPTLI